MLCACFAHCTQLLRWRMRSSRRNSPAPSCLVPFVSYQSSSHPCLPFLFASWLNFWTSSFLFFSLSRITFFIFLLFLGITFRFLLFFFASLMRCLFPLHYSQRGDGFIEISRRSFCMFVQRYMNLFLRIGLCWFLGLFLERMPGGSRLNGLE